MYIVDITSIYNLHISLKIQSKIYILQYTHQLKTQTRGENMAKNWLDWVALVLVIVGAVNWGLVGVGGWDLVDLIFGSVEWLARLIYILVGLAGLYTIWFVSRE